MQIRAGAAVALAGAMLGAPPGAAFAADDPCSSDTFVVGDSPIVVQVCDVALVRPASAGTVRETLSVKGRSPLVRDVRYERLTSEEARTVDDVPLEALGIAKTMHLTLAIHSGTARVEHALLIPGALSLK